MWLGVLGGLRFYLLMGCSGIMVVHYVDDGSGLVSGCDSEKLY
jgi:hypothetical protein